MFTARPTRRLVVAALSLSMLAGFSGPATAGSAAELDAAASATLARLVQAEPVTRDMLERAAGVLVFPEIVKGGLLVGAAAGKGVLRVGGRTRGIYRSTAVSYGLQAGISAFGYVMALMDQQAVDFVRDTKGWEVGVGPNVTVADESFARRLSTSTAQEGIYVFFVDQKGLFAGAGIEGTKITQIAE